MPWLSRPKVGGQSSRTLRASGRYWSRQCFTSWPRHMSFSAMFSRCSSISLCLCLRKGITFRPWVLLSASWTVQVTSSYRCRPHRVKSPERCENCSIKAPSLHSFPGFLPSEGVHWGGHTLRRPVTTFWDPEVRRNFLLWGWRKFRHNQVDDLKLTWFAPQSAGGLVHSFSFLLRKQLHVQATICFWRLVSIFWGILVVEQFVVKHPFLPQAGVLRSVWIPVFLLNFSFSRSLDFIWKHEVRLSEISHETIRNTKTELHSTGSLAKVHFGCAFLLWPSCPLVLLACWKMWLYCFYLYACFNHVSATSLLQFVRSVCTTKYSFLNFRKLY